MTPIVLEAVAPTRRELRPVRRGWGAIHWLYCLPYVVAGVALWILGGIAVDYGAPLIVFPLGVVGGLVAAALSAAVARDAVARATRNAPTGTLLWSWTVDEQGLGLDSPIQSGRLDWRAVKDVREDADRFVFLVTPAFNSVLPKRLLTPDQLGEFQALISQLRQNGVLGRGVD